MDQLVQVKQAYKKLALRWHPDVLPVQDRAKAEVVFKDIVAAYNRISKGLTFSVCSIVATSHLSTRTQLGLVICRWAGTCGVTTTQQYTKSSRAYSAPTPSCMHACMRLSQVVLH